MVTIWIGYIRGLRTMSSKTAKIRKSATQNTYPKETTHGHTTQEKEVLMQDRLRMKTP